MLGEPTGEAEDARPGKYLRVWLLPLLVIQLAAMLTCVVVDPRSVFQHGLLPALEDHRMNRTRTAKLERALRGDFDTLVLGSSRVHMGIDAGNEVFAAERAFNLGLAASTLAETVDVTELLIARDVRPGRIVLLTQLDQLGHHQGTNKQIARSLLDPELTALAYHFGHMFGYASLKDAFTVIARWRTPESVYTDRLGNLRLRFTPKRSRAAFEDRLRREWAKSGDELDFAVLERLGVALAKLCARGKDVRVAISPVHGLHLALWLDQHGLSTYERMLRWYAALPDATATACVRVWDCSGFEGARAEVVPPLDKPVPGMRYYVESSHFRPEVGDNMLTQILGRKPDSDVDLRGFPLNGRTVAADLARLARERSAFEADFEADLAWMRSLRRPSKPTMVAGHAR